MGHPLFIHHYQYTFQLNTCVIISLASFNASMLSCAKPFCYIFPVDDREDIFDIVGANVFILKVIGMFPNINSQ